MLHYLIYVICFISLMLRPRLPGTSVSLLDTFIFALAPLGILTATVSAIRVCGNSSLRAFIGRAQEDPGEAEHELLSCVSETTAELFNNGGISRVFGRARLLEVVAWKDKDPVSKEDSWKTGTLRDALQQGAWTARDGTWNFHEKDYSLPELDIPNLSLNKGTARRSQGWLYCAAVLGFVLQIDEFKKDGQPVKDYALPLFLIGTVSLCTGMFLCAFIVERSSREFYFHPVKPSKIYWLQPGGQNIGDQFFSSFLGVNEGPGSQPTEDLIYIKSLAKLTADADGIQRVAHNLARAIEATMDLISTWQHVSKDSHHKFIAPNIESYAINLERTDDTPQWRVQENELEAVLGLWTWSLLTSNPEWMQGGLGRLAGLSESEAKEEDTDLYFHKWIFRQKEARMVSSKMICLPQRMFGYYADEYLEEKEILVVKTDNRLETMAAQDIYVQFIKSVVGGVTELGGDTTILPCSQNGYVAHNSRLDDLVSCFESSNLGSREDALLCIVPVLKHRDLLPRLSGNSSVVRARLEELIASGSWREAFGVLWWLCERSEGAEFDHSMFALGYLCRRAMLDTNPDVQTEGCNYAYRAIETDPRTRFIKNLRNNRPAGWMDANKRPENWNAFSLQLGWIMWHTAQRHSDRGTIQQTLESLGINENSVTAAKAKNDEDQGRMGEQAVLQWLTKGEEAFLGYELHRIEGHLALDWVCQNGHHALLNWLIVRWAEYDRQCPGFIYNILSWAAKGGYGSAIALLRQHGVDLDMQELSEESLARLIRECALLRETPLMTASHVGDLVSLLLRRGANVNARSNGGQTPFLFATAGNHVAVAQILLDHGAKINLSNNEGVTAAVCAVSENHIEMVKYLLSEGAHVTKLLLTSGAGTDIHERMLSGMTAFEWARKSYQTECVQLLKAAFSRSLKNTFLFFFLQWT
ncbi:hypothetical protein BDV23DRAFT_175492 [Aspergillus alliaceus]|uniref:Uncharacterized protein n=1 Tax=Petromyces alliaceus TaxID=209559 RepID=A0A5N7BXC9_PETAA|nr:hypothetical protein BDV23DRAFT_175492 [Aspergillus alliaceus]